MNSESLYLILLMHSTVLKLELRNNSKSMIGLNAYPSLRMSKPLSISLRNQQSKWLVE